MTDLCIGVACQRDLNCIGSHFLWLVQNPFNLQVVLPSTGLDLQFLQPRQLAVALGTRASAQLNPETRICTGSRI